MERRLAAIAWLLASSAATNTGPQLPDPTGPSPVGTTVAYLVDGARKSSEFPDGRPITLQLWYPIAPPDSGAAVAPYVIERGLADALAAQGYYEIDAAVLAGWSKLSTHSRLDAQPLEGSHPLVSFSVGLGVLRANYASITEELASHG